MRFDAETRSLEMLEDLIERRCPQCGQTEYHTGEYPCSLCSRPMLWDEDNTSKQTIKGEKDE